MVIWALFVVLHVIALSPIMIEELLFAKYESGGNQFCEYSVLGFGVGW
jgi:hypothetical protein